jgi:NDP-4-keto-2,6-dideoxyhexose 3-C-methyltransferase
MHPSMVDVRWLTKKLKVPASPKLPASALIVPNMSQQTAVAAKACRICGSARLEEVLSLGEQYVSDFVTESGHSVQEPLELVRCANCGLVQLKHTFSREKLYRHYWYRSGISKTMRVALADLTARTCEIAEPTPNDIVVDIGCNDGTLLRSYSRKGLFLVGFEPARNLVPDAENGTNLIFNDFFGAEIFRKRFGDRRAKIITTVAMFYDLDDPNSFVADIRKILSHDGVWVVQQNYLATMLEQNGFDNIGHEHLEYYSLGTMQTLLLRHGLEVFEVEVNDVNGGSFRTFISFKGRYPIGKTVGDMQDREKKLGLDQHSTYEKLAAEIQKISSEVRDFIVQEVKAGKTVYVYGASNRGNTILQYFGLDNALISKATDANPDKWGRKTVGTLIPIVSKEEARKDQPDYFVILPHHFLNEIVNEERDYLQSGGKFIVPLPRFSIVSNESLQQIWHRNSLR